MKKTLVKLGVLAAALALALVVVSCEQPTDEGSSGPGSPTIIRLYLDRDDASLKADDRLFLLVSKALYVPAGLLPTTASGAPAFPYPRNVSTDGRVENETTNDTVAVTNFADVKVIPARRAQVAGQADWVSQINDPKTTVLASGIITLKDEFSQTQLEGGSTIQVPPKGPYYVDIELIDQTPGDVNRGNIYQKSISGYVELLIDKDGDYLDPTGIPFNGTTAAITGSLPDAYYLYTKDKHGFNDRWILDQGAPLYKTTNSNIKKVSLKPGINELYLSYFSYDRAEN